MNLVLTQGVVVGVVGVVVKMDLSLQRFAHHLCDPGGSGEMRVVGGELGVIVDLGGLMMVGMEWLVLCW